MAMDPVCGMHVDEETAQWHAEHHGKTYYFCSPGCMHAFKQEPEKFLGDGSPPSEHEHHHG